MTLWPNSIFSAGLASKEGLLAAIIPLCLLSYLWSYEAQSVRNRFIGSIAAGLSVGVASLVQPSFMLFPAVFCADIVIRRCFNKASIIRVALIGLGALVVIAPWSMRNYAVFNEFVPIATNGGDVFYRANNSAARAGYSERGEIDLRQLNNETQRNRIGFQLGKEWINANPLQFLGLTIKRQIVFLGESAIGAYETLKRGLDMDGSLYVLFKGVSNGAWLAVWIVIIAAWRLHRNTFDQPDLVLLQLVFLYLLAIDSVFESGARHHVPVLGLLIILATTIVTTKKQTTSGLRV